MGGRATDMQEMALGRAALQMGAKSASNRQACVSVSTSTPALTLIMVATADPTAHVGSTTALQPLRAGLVAELHVWLTTGLVTLVRSCNVKPGRPRRLFPRPGEVAHA